MIDILASWAGLALVEAVAAAALVRRLWARDVTST